jgi:arginyl-tRNA synthetase
MFLSKTLARLLLPYINDRKDLYGKDLSIGLADASSPQGGRKKLLIEFSSPNIASEFHGKNLRSTILGACISNLYESMGWNVVKMNYLGDWGKQIGLLTAGWKRFGSEEAFQADPVGHMLHVYTQIDQLFQPEQTASKAARDSGGDTATIENHGLFAERNDYFKKMEEGDEQSLALWRRFRDASIDYYIKLYASMNVSFDEYSGESQVNVKTMDEIENQLRIKGLLEESERSWSVDLKKHTNKSGRVIIRDRNGSRTYQLRELAAVLDRFRKYNFDKMIYVVADDHDLHFSRIIKVLELLDMSDLAHKIQHVHFNKGSQMSEKLGQGHVLDEILDKSKSAMQVSLKEQPGKSALFSNSDETATVLGISALLAQELTGKRASDHFSDLDKMTAFSRGTGPELQYWYARLSMILKATNPDIGALSEEDLSSIEEEKYTELLRILVQYPDITSVAYKLLEPSIIMHYLLSITDQLDVCFESEEDQEEVDVTPSEAALFEVVRQVLENSMKLLGMTLITE